LILEYDHFRQQLVRTIFRELPESSKEALRKEKREMLQEQDRFDRIPPEAREHEIEQLILQDLAKKEAPPFERWLLRRRARQAVLPFDVPETPAEQ
jgi:hypothetical protein